MASIGTVLGSPVAVLLSIYPAFLIVSMILGLEAQSWVGIIVVGGMILMIGWYLNRESVMRKYPNVD